MTRTDEVREQAIAAVSTAIEQIRTPLLAALGAGDLAAKAVTDAVQRAKERAETTRTAVNDLPQRVDPVELRKLVDEYTDAAVKLYQKLADQGEDTLGKLKTQPQVKKAIEQLEEAIATAQARAGDVAGDARTLAEDVLTRVTRKTRSVGEKTAITAERVAAEVAEAVEEAGDDLAHEVRSTSRRVANKTAPARKPATARPATNGAARKSTPKTDK
jgi:heparin binding hemagglutinin HbhA